MRGAPIGRTSRVRAVLRGCPRHELETVQSNTTPVNLLAGTVLCLEGDYGQEAFIIVAGEAEAAQFEIGPVATEAVPGFQVQLPHIVDTQTTDDRDTFFFDEFLVGRMGPLPLEAAYGLEIFFRHNSSRS